MSHNTLIHQVVRPVVRAIASTGVTPNQITTLRLVSALGAAAGFAVGGRLWPDIGGALFILSMMLDRADGELARQTGKSTHFGYQYDVASDCLADIATFVGIGIGQFPMLGLTGPSLGVVAGISIAILFMQLYVLKLREMNGIELFRGEVTVDVDDAMIAVPVAIWLGLAMPLLVTAAIVAPLVALYFGISPHAPTPTDS